MGLLRWSPRAADPNVGGAPNKLQLTHILETAPPPEAVSDPESRRRPLTWLVNGRPLANLANSGMSQRADWMPDGEGLARVTVIDARGASAEVWLAGEE
ncbi:MAG TPA: hypothetical protein VNN09_00770 [Candidatus Competibacteraceae bacterium]|nr:hypothetical protein [Candidatus Competibacteraceae bacterium]